MAAMSIIVPVAVAMTALALGVVVYVIGRADRIHARNRQIARNGTEAVKSARKSLVWLNRALEKAGIAVAPSTFAILWLMVAGVLAFASASFTNILAAAVVVVAFTAATGIALRMKAKKRMGAFDEQLGESLPMVAENIRSGQTFESAVAIVAEYTDEPLKSQFKIMAMERQMGTSLEAATNNLAARVGSRDAAMLASVIAVQTQTGGSIADVLDSIANAIQRRNKQRRRVAAMTADGKLSAAIIGAIPVVVFTALMVISPGYLDALFTTAVGRIALGVSVVMVIAGLLVVRKLYTIEIY